MENKKSNILVPLDFSEQSIYALELAIPFAKRIDAEIIMLYVNQDKGLLSMFFPAGSTDVFEEEVAKKLEELANRYQASNDIKIRYWISRASSIHGKIVEYAAEHGSEMIVMGKGYMFSDKNEKSPILGSNTSRVIRYATCPVVTTGSEVKNHECKKILLPLDLTKTSRQKVTWALKIAKYFSSEIHVVSALFDTNDQVIVSHLTNQLHQVQAFINRSGVKCSAELIKDKTDAKSLIPILTNYLENHPDIDLMMIMTQQEKSFNEFFLGSMASELIRKSNIPVMSVIPMDTGDIILGL